MSKFIVKQVHLGNSFYLRSTAWTGDITRADRFETVEAAQAKFEKAKMFMKAKQIKAVTIEQEA
jgi:hypothetical protein